MGKLPSDGLQDDASAIRREAFQIADNTHREADTIHVYKIAYANLSVNRNPFWSDDSETVCPPFPVREIATATGSEQAELL